MNSNAGRKRVVILGGGSGGIVAATNLGRAVGARHEVVLVDRRPNHVFMPAFLFLMVGQRRPEQISRRLVALQKRNVKVVQAEVEGIDPIRQEVMLHSGPLPYDYLIISLGLQTMPELIPGFSQGAHHAWELEDAMRLHSALERFERGRVLVGLPPGPYRCPPAPYETQWMLDAYFTKRGIRDRVTIEAFTRDPEPIGEDRFPAVWMDGHSKSRNIRQHYEFVAKSINPEKQTVSGLYGFELTYDLLVMVPPHRPAPVLVDSRLAETENGIRVDYDTLVTKWPNVFAIGDCADMPASKAGGVAHQQADVVAHNVATELTRHGEPVTLRLHTL